MQSTAEIIGAWPSAAELARDLELPEITVRKWRTRGSIPAPHWVSVVSAAEKRGYTGVTVEALAAIAASHQRREAAA